MLNLFILKFLLVQNKLISSAEEWVAGDELKGKLSGRRMEGRRVEGWVEEKKSTLRVN